jgi:DNA repair photolyase
VYVKQHDWQETARKLRTAARSGEPVALGTATDPYQPGETEWRVTRRFLELCAQFRGLKLSITTKGAVIVRDLELLRRIRAGGELSLHLSLISLRADLVRQLEPWAPPPQVRIDVLRRLCDAGLDPWLSISPVLPGLTDAEADLDALLAAARAAGVRHARYNVLFLRSPTREKYLEFLKPNYPKLHEAHERAYAGRVFLRGKYPERLRALFRTLAVRHGFEAEPWSDVGPEPPRTDARQLGLWGS